MGEFGYPANTQWAMSTDGAAWINFTVGSQIAQSDFYLASAGLTPPFVWRTADNPVAFGAHVGMAGRGAFEFTPDLTGSVKETFTQVTENPVQGSTHFSIGMTWKNVGSFADVMSFDWAANPTAVLSESRMWIGMNAKWRSGTIPGTTLRARGNLQKTAGGGIPTQWERPQPDDTYVSDQGFVTNYAQALNPPGPYANGIGWRSLSYYPGTNSAYGNYTQAQALTPNVVIFQNWQTQFNGQTVTPSAPGGQFGFGTSYFNNGALFVVQYTASVTQMAYGEMHELFWEWKFD